MSTGNRHFDPESAEEFINFLEEQVAILDDHILWAYFQNGGELTRMPAFGIGAGEMLATKYRTFHGGVWAALHTVRADYLGFIEALRGIVEANEATEAATTAEFGEFT